MNNPGLGKYPAVSVTDTSGRVVFGDVLHESADVALIRFSAPFSGAAVAN